MAFYEFEYHGAITVRWFLIVKLIAQNWKQSLVLVSPRFSLHVACSKPQ